MADPKIGEMIVYDYIRPPLLDGEYRIDLSTTVAVKNAPQPLDGQNFYFNVEGPRFSLSPSEVAGVFPPRNGHGSFESALPHVALGRRTLPWERALGDAYTAGPDETPYPFLALVVLEKSEYEIKRNMRLEDIVPAAVFQRLGSPTGIRCDAVEADEQLLNDILPMPAELQLLTHVRHVNVDDRELAAGDSDGFFAVVVSNRLPRAGGTYAACLVSVEERTDLLPTTDIVVVHGVEGFLDATVAEMAVSSALSPSEVGTSITAESADLIVRYAPIASKSTATTAGAAQLSQPSVKGELVLSNAALEDRARAQVSVGAGVLHPTARLVLLHSWTFTCDGDGTFRQLMQQVDVGMIGDVDPASKLAVTDTGHIRIDVTDRMGAPEQSWYRGPLVPQPLTRDPLGPYHSADQARRVVADTGAENISYASAFEVGRLLAAADGRLAQELMRWRRGAYRASARQSAIDLLRDTMRLVNITDLRDPVALRYSVDVLGKIAAGIGPLVDPYDIDAVLASPLLQPAAIAQAFGLASIEEAQQLLGVDVALTTPVAAVPEAPSLLTLDQVINDSAGFAALTAVRQRVIANVATALKGEQG